MHFRRSEWIERAFVEPHTCKYVAARVVKLVKHESVNQTVSHLANPSTIGVEVRVTVVIREKRTANSWILIFLFNLRRRPAV